MQSPIWRKVHHGMSSTLTCKDIEKAILDGRRAFDFLQGDEDYKYIGVTQLGPNWVIPTAIYGVFWPITRHMWGSLPANCVSPNTNWGGHSPTGATLYGLCCPAKANYYCRGWATAVPSPTQISAPGRECTQAGWQRRRVVYSLHRGNDLPARGGK